MLTNKYNNERSVFSVHKKKCQLWQFTLNDLIGQLIINIFIAMLNQIKILKSMKSILVYSFTLAMLSFSTVSCIQTDQKKPAEVIENNVPKKDALEFKDFGNDPFVFNIETYTKENETYRTTLWTGEFMQLTLMSILPGEDIGLEVHTDHDQFIRVEEGEGIVMMGDAEDDLSYQEKVKDDFAIMIPAGKWHNVLNDSDKPLKLYSIYAPKEHKHSTVHKTREEAIADEHDH